MSGYAPPLETFAFVIENVLDAPRSWSALPVFDALDTGVAREILAQAGSFAQGVLAPLNGAGDLEGCRWTAGSVTTPAGFPDAWRRFVDAGWPALARSPDCGGQGLPVLLEIVLLEMAVSANHAWTMYPGLLHGAYEVLRKHATATLRERYLPKIVSGEWLATMALTEPQAGSDLSLLRTRAEPAGSGSAGNGDPVLVTGTKTFISGGEHDLSDNIVHLVLARLPEAPVGTKGLSLALVPKILPDGSRNPVHCDGIERKMGLKGSATCQMRFEAARGWLVGDAHGGLSAMFLMMNAARLHVGVQGLGHLEAATQRAHAYALQRRQMRAPARLPDAPAAAADPIAQHPAIRRKLLELAAQAQGARILAYWAACLMDEHEHHPEERRRRDCGELLSLLTPVVKAFLTELGHVGANEALGVLGGYGYIHEYGIEQQVRDSRAALIYEGTNEIQAIDLVVRKLSEDRGGLPLLLEEFRRAADSCRAAEAAAEADAPILQRAADALLSQTQRLGAATATLSLARRSDPEAPYRVADDMLHAMGHALLAWAWARAASAAMTLPAGRLRREQLTLASFGLDWLLPVCQWRWQRIEDWQKPLPSILVPAEVER